MRLILHSNSPVMPTGYGIQTALLAARLRDAGHEVAISVYSGHDIGLGTWEGMPLLPSCSANDPHGIVSLAEHAFRWFNQDHLGGWIIPITDSWILNQPFLADFNIAPWTPVDHFPTPKAVRETLRNLEAVPIAMSQYAETQLRASGFDPLYAPLVVNTNVFQPVDNARATVGLPEDAFVVMMNGMNKGVSPNRKGFPEAFAAFAAFATRHNDVVLYLHTEMTGAHAHGISLYDLALMRGVADHQMQIVDQYAYKHGFVGGDQLAAAYSAADVLLAPSRGEGFCVPLIEAQACGTPVIVTDFSAQPELVGAGWKVGGEPEWDAAQESDYVKASIPALIDALEQAYEERGSEANRAAALAFGRSYDADLRFERHWKPILSKLAGDAKVELDRPPIPKTADAVAVIVPALNRPQNVKPLVDSFRAASGTVANLYFVCDDDDTDQIAAVKDAGATVLPATRGSTFAQKVNAGYEQTTEPWLFVTGDDVVFHRGWIDAARRLSGDYDVIGTNDSTDGTGNPRVASGSHADHFFLRRSYVDTYGGSLAGLVCHEGYRHFYSDVEVIELAKARGVFTPCLQSIVEHLHPDLRRDVPVDSTYQKGWSEREHDKAEWVKRRPLVEMQREGLGKVRAA